MFMKRNNVLGIFLIATFLIASCSDSSINSPETDKPSPSVASTAMDDANLQGDRDIDLNGMDSMDDINAMLADKDMNIRLAYAETITPYNENKKGKGKSGIKKNGVKKGGKEAVGGQTIFANDRTKRLGAQWVPGDERRLADGNNLTHTIFDPFAPANFGFPDQFDGSPAINASLDTWNNVKKNAKLDIVQLANTNTNPSAILGGDPFQADISTFGFVPPLFLELFVGPGSSSSVLGVTFTFVFTDEDGNPTDINNDGYDDVAVKEVWYNDAFVWTDQGDAATGVDVETVALHENGHALGFAHFGKIFVTNGNGKLHVAPRAVMNAINLGEQRELLGTDKASYNSIYGSWPN